MNKRQVISSLNNIAEELDNNGLYVEASTITNVMKKVAQLGGVTDSLTQKVQVSLGEVENLQNIIMGLEQRNRNTAIDISKASLGLKISNTTNTLRRILMSMTMKPTIQELQYYGTNYSPKSLVELRDYISRFYKKENQNYSQNNSMKTYLTDLANFTKTAVDTLNKLALNKPITGEPSAENSTEEPTQV